MTKIRANAKAAVCMLLVLLLALTMVSFPANVSALSLSKTSYTLTKGYGFTLKVSGNDSGAAVTWSTSDKSVATVSSAGKVVGKSAGNATITADVGGSKLTCAVKVVGGKLSVSSKNVTVDEGSYKYITVRAKGSHGLKAASSDKSIVTANWITPWDNDDIKLKLTGKGAGTTTVKIYLTKYPDVYVNINVTVGSNSTAVLQTSQASITTMVGTPASITIYSDVSNSLNYTLSDSTVATVKEGTWSNNYCTLTVNGLKAGTTNLTITRKDDTSVSKVIPITVTGSSYYQISDAAISKTTSTDIVYRWIDSSTNTYRYMLLPANYDLAKVNTVIAKDSGKYDYYTVYEESPTTKVASTDTIYSFTATVNSSSVTRYVMVPADYDKPSMSTAVAMYTGQFEYWTIYNVSPENYKKRYDDVIKTWSATVNYKSVTRYMLVPADYDQSIVDSYISSDSGTDLAGYYTVTLAQPSLITSTDKVLSFTATISNSTVTYYVLVPADYDEARFNDIVASYTGKYSYYKIYNTEPTKLTSFDIIESWTKIIDDKTTTRYVLLPVTYSSDAVATLKNNDLKTQTSSYYTVTAVQPVKIASTDETYAWYNPNTGVTKWMLLPQDYSIVKRNDIVASDTGVYNYYTMYSTKPTAKTDTDVIFPFNHMSYGQVYMLLPANYDQSKVNDGMAGKTVQV